MLLPILREQQLVLYGTVGCHLCDIAEQLLLPWVEQGWQIELIDIADHDDLLQQFAMSIPVLAHVASNKLLVWPFDAESVQDFLALITIEVT